MSDGKRPQTRYENEIASLPEAFDSARTPPDSLVEAVANISRRPACFVGSGGSLAVAQLAADLHKSSTRTAAWATTPLLSISEPALPQSAFVLCSSSGRHPDAVAAVSAARARGHDPVVMISQTPLGSMPDRVQRANPAVAVVRAPRDGFLATASVIASSTALVAVHGYELPTSDDVFALSPLSASLRTRILVLYGWGLENVAVDIEARLSELGLATVQLADYRNFAHGRHVGLSRNQAATTILALTDPMSQAIAERTLSELPGEADVVVLASRFTWPVSAIELLTQSCSLPLLLADFDPAKPEVPDFGRKLYHLPVDRILETGLSHPPAAPDRTGGPGGPQACR